MLTAELSKTLEEIGLGDKWRQEGWQEGEKKRALEIARKMLDRSKPVDEIVEYTGVTVEELENLRNMLAAI